MTTQNRRETIDHQALQRLAAAGALRGITVAGETEGWTVVAHVREAQYPLAGQRGGIRHFRRMETAVKYLREAGVNRFEVDARGFDMEAMLATRRRPDTAAALKRAHDAAEYDRWFRAEVEKAVEEADCPDAEWYSWEEIERSTKK